jgi:RimJ/RimL family protein N-acetyltransferase
MGAGWMWGTARWDEVVIEVTRAMKRHILPTLDARGVHRIECRTMANHTASIRWLETLGFKREAVTAQFGQGREDFILLARVAERAARRH